MQARKNKNFIQHTCFYTSFLSFRSRLWSTISLIIFIVCLLLIGVRKSYFFWKLRFKQISRKRELKIRLNIPKKIKRILLQLEVILACSFVELCYGVLQTHCLFIDFLRNLVNRKVLETFGTRD